MKHFDRNNRPVRASKALLLVAGGLLTVSLFTPVSAQPGGGMGGQGGGNQQGGGMGQQGGGRQGGRGGNRAQMREQMLKQQLTNAGYTDTTLQNAVLAAVKAKESGRQPLYDAANALSEGLDDQNATDESVGKLYDALTLALEAEKIRVKAVELQLDTQIKFSKDKRLTAVLTLAGVIGDALSYLSSAGGGQGGPPGGGQGGMSGQGGRGGGQGGPGGGMGQQGGGFNGQGGQGGPPGPPQDF